MFGTLLRFAGGLIVGAAVGTVIGRLIAPSSGQELQQSIVDFRNEIIEAGVQAEEETRRTLQAEFSQARQFRPSG
jgi:gas vesicle protein